jgi:signal transduction histidine kinase/CheY-like chemotaxis protein
MAVPLQTFDPPVIIVDYRLSDIAYSEPKNIQLDLSYQANFLNLKFSALELARTDEYQYISKDYVFRYFMEGIDRDTALTGTELTAQYRNLRPGRYNFWVARSKHPELRDSSTVNMSFMLRIRSPWYRSALALGSYILFLGLLISGITMYRTAKLRKDKLHLEKAVARRTEELQEKNEQILEMERLKTRFFTDVSHEIRTPLTLISGPLEQLVNQDFRDPRILHWLSLIRRNSHVRMLAEEYLSFAESKDIKYIIDIAGEKLEKVTTNLLSNAFKFTFRGSTVTCRMKLYGGTSNTKDPLIRLLVADTGPGIPSGIKERIFDRFYRGEGDASHFANGTGTGLALTRELVSIMHGEIQMRSSVGEGTVFMVTFPCGCSHLKPDEYIIKEQKDQQDFTNSWLTEQCLLSKGTQLHNKHISILVVEDNKDLQAFIIENLSAEFSVKGTDNGDQGYSMAISELPDLIITVVMMPGEMDGVELCRQLKSTEQTSHIPVVMLTAKSTAKDKKSVKAKRKVAEKIFQHDRVGLGGDHGHNTG